MTANRASRTLRPCHLCAARLTKFTTRWTGNDFLNRDHHALAYRPDIDGLRAIAVLSVVLFHARVPFIPGGFVGVDIFFVISGYLITVGLIKDTSIVRFYQRRARRILPALFCTLLVSILAGLLMARACSTPTSRRQR